MTPVAVTGIGVVSAFGIGVEPFWDGLVAGRSALAPLTRLGTPGVVCAGEVRALAPRDFVRSAVGRRIDRTSLLALAACRLALADAGAPLDGLDPTRFGLALGSAFGNFGETTGFLDRLFARGAGNPLVFPNLVLNAGLSYASIELGVTGPTACLTEQEASGEAAIAWGGRLVADGAADVSLAGAADELDGTLCEVLRAAGLMAAGAPRPFDPGADGTAPGEGAAVVVLEPLARARARRARIYARLVTHPGFAVPAPVHGWPSDPGPLATGLGPLLAQVELVVASACGYPARDGLEGAALVRALAGRRVAVTAPRAAVGDFGSAGALGVAVAALAVYTGVVPPTLGVNGNGPRGLDVVIGARGGGAGTGARGSVPPASPGGGVSAPSDPFPKLPHTAPFLLLDRVLDVDERRGVFVKLVAAADPLVAPDGTLPAAFLVEALAQGGGALLNALGRAGWTAGYLAAVDDFRTHHLVRVGDTLRVEVEIQRHVGGATMFRGRALVEEVVVAEGRFTLAVPR